MLKCACCSVEYNNYDMNNEDTYVTLIDSIVKKKENIFNEKLLRRRIRFISGMHSYIRSEIFKTEY